MNTNKTAVKEFVKAVDSHFGGYSSLLKWWGTLESYGDCDIRYITNSDILTKTELDIISRTPGYKIISVSVSAGVRLKVLIMKETRHINSARTTGEHNGTKTKM